MAFLVAVMFLLTWPYIELHSLRAKFLAIAQAHYPGVLVRAKAAFNFIKTLGMHPHVHVYTINNNCLLGNGSHDTHKSCGFVL